MTTKNPQPPAFLLIWDFFYSKLSKTAAISQKFHMLKTGLMSLGGKKSTKQIIHTVTFSITPFQKPFPPNQSVPLHKQLPSWLGWEGPEGSGSSTTLPWAGASPTTPGLHEDQGLGMWGCSSLATEISIHSAFPGGWSQAEHQYKSAVNLTYLVNKTPYFKIHKSSTAIDNRGRHSPEFWQLLVSLTC